MTSSFSLHYVFLVTSGLLHVGDIIKEINGQDVTDPDQLTDIMKKTSGSVTLKVLPSYYDAHNFSQVRHECTLHNHTHTYTLLR